MNNKLFDYFPRSIKLLDYMTDREQIEAYYNPHIKTGHIRIQYYYSGLYVLFLGKIENKDRKYIEKYEIFVRFSGSQDSHFIEPSTILYEEIPSFNPLKQILQHYNLHDIIKTAYSKTSYNDYD